MKTTTDFLHWLRPDGPWTLTAIVPDTKPTKITTKIFTNLHAAGKWALARNKTANVYYAVNPLLSDYKVSKKAKKTDVAALSFLHLDIDPAPGKPIEAERARIRGIINSIEPRPSMVIDSGGGFNCLWRLNEPVPVSDQWPVDRLEAFNVQLEHLYAGDKCHNIDRILRLPGTVNWPNAKKRANGRVKAKAEIPLAYIAAPSVSYDLDAFSRPVEAATARSEGAHGAEDPAFDLSILDDGLLAKIADPGEPNRSGHIVGVAVALLRKGASRAAIEAILIDPDHGCSGHCLDQDDSARAAGRAVDAAEAYIKKHAQAQEAIFSFASSAPSDQRYSSTVASMLKGGTLSTQKREALVVLVAKRSGESKGSIRKLFNEAAALPLPKAFLDAHVYLTKQKIFIHRADLREMDQTQFDNHHAAKWPIRNDSWPASAVFLNSGGQQCYQATYMPGGEDIIGKHPNAKYNIWRPGTLELSHGDVGPWLAHAAWLIPDEAILATVLDRMAFDVQHPDQKANWHVFLGGMQGIGKNLFTWPLINILGRHNCRTIGPEVLAAQWGDWLQGKKLLFVDELLAFGKKEMNNKLKAFLASPPEALYINKKYGGIWDLPNLISFWFGSNSPDALQLENSDRRMMMVWSAVEPEEPAYYAGLWKWLADHAGDVGGYLSKRDLSTFDAKGIAPMTRYKAEVIQRSRDPLEAFLHDAKEARTWPMRDDLVSPAKLIRIMWPHGVGKVTPNKLARALEAIKCEDLGRVLLADGSKPTIWAVRLRTDGFSWTHLKPDALREAVNDALHRWDHDDRGQA